MEIRFSVSLMFSFFMIFFVGIGNVVMVQADSVHYNAIADSSYKGVDGMKVGGIKTYKSIGKALDDAPADGIKPYLIYIKIGRYYEKLKVEKPFITFLGENKDKTILTFDAASGTLSSNGTKYGTSGSGTIIVRAANFRAENITIENGFDFVANQNKESDDPTKVKDTQAVALKLEYQSDKAVFRNVKMTGYQDTLYVDAGRSYFIDCYISGHIDFIFGAGQAVFNNCTIVSRLGGYVTAPSTKEDEQYGILIMNSRLEKEGIEVADGSVNLGRPWHPGGRPGVNSEVAYINCYMDNHISAEGWSSMSGFRPEDSRFYEYGSNGPGARTSLTRQLLSEKDAQNFSFDHVLNGWNPEENKENFY
ncbi:pectinesterase [Pelosinus propionicus DSM 13327]|uniref:Pectinesterase n=2 Tax=Pelosinus TaxID=365348 RepID=A0A1I4JVX2_9FIRM|nr:pectinesterase [Pelosinus propionicus DSM 13327]